MEIVRTLSQCGAHLGLTPPDLADILVTAAAQGKHHLVHCLLVAGASPDLYLCGSGNTGLHAATEVSREREGGLGTYLLSLYCTILYCIALHCIVLYCTVLYFTVLYLITM